MATITRYPFLRHLRSEPSRHLLHFSRGKLAHSGRGLALWFSPLSSTLAEIPCDDREQSFLVHGRSQDYQDVIVQGVITWRAAEPERVAQRVDFSLDPRSGQWREKPLDHIADVLVNFTQHLAVAWLAEHDVRAVLDQGAGELRARLRAGLAANEELAAMGLAVAMVAVTKVAPSAELERALQTPALEALQQQADQATFQRRAQAVEKERAIAENELSNKIELAGREHELIAQLGDDARRRAGEEAEAQRIAAEGAAARSRLAAEADAANVKVLEEARVTAERARFEVFRDLEPHVLMGVAAREFAGKLSKIDHLNLTPDLLQALLGDLVSARAKPAAPARREG
jgi:hypothetical protein